MTVALRLSEGGVIKIQAPLRNDSSVVDVKSRLTTPSRLHVDGRVVVVDDTDEHRVTDETIAAMTKHPAIFVVGPSLSEIDSAHEIRAITRDRARDLASACAMFVQLRKNDSGEFEERDVHPPRYIGASILSRPNYPGVAPLDGVVRSPILRASGSIHDEPGYDAETRLFYAPACTYPPIPTSPTQDDARRAYRHLEELFTDFPMEHRELGTAVAIALPLTLLARHLVDHAPTFVFSSPTPGAGKGLLVDVGSTIGSSSSLPRSPWPADGDEQRKLLEGFALRGAQGVLLDNIVTPLGGADLERVVTSTTVDIRVLGKTETLTCRFRGTFAVTGRSVRYAGDMPRRCLQARLVPADDRPDQRSNFRFSRLLEHVRAHRPEFVRDALTILSAHARAGRPGAARGGVWGSFEAWTNVVADAIVFAGGHDAVEARVVRDARVDNVVEALEGLVRLWRAYGGPLGTEVACAQMVSRCGTDEEARVFLDELLDEQAPAKGSETKASRLSSVLARNAERWIAIDGALFGFIRGGSGKFGRRWMLTQPSTGGGVTG